MACCVHRTAPSALASTTAAAGIRLVHPHVFGEVGADPELARDETFGLLPLLVAENEPRMHWRWRTPASMACPAPCSPRTWPWPNFARGIVAGMTHINDITVDDQPNARSVVKRIPASVASTVTMPWMSLPVPIG